MTAALALPDTFFHTRDNPWLECGGVALEHAPRTVDEAIREAKLDWDVALRRLAFEKADGTFAAVPDRFAVVRTDTEQVLGQVGKTYKPFGNAEAFAFADGLVDGGLVFDSAGTYYGGRRIYLAARLPEHVQVLGEDPYDLYLFLVTSHDGTSSITAYVTPVRIRCRNMLRLSLRQATTMWRISHYSTAEGRIQEARDALALTFQAQGEFDREMEELVRTTLAEDALRAAVRDVLPDTPTRDKKVAQVLEVYGESPSLDLYRGTAYAGLQAFAEWLDWGRSTRSANGRFQTSFEGYGARWRDALHDRLLAAA